MTKKKTLEEFIDDNHRLISVVGIFGALSAYFSTISTLDAYSENVDFLGYFMAFTMFVMFLLICFEMFKRFLEYKNRTFSLELFAGLFFIFILLLVCYMYFAFRTPTMMVIWSIITILYFSLFYIIYISFDAVFHIGRKLKRNKFLKPLRDICGFTIFLLILLLSLILGIFTTILITSFLPY